MKENCIFCKIIEGQIPSVQIWENEDFLAILDINPNTQGVTLVIPKGHYSAKVFEMPEEIYQKLWRAVRTVTGILERGLEVLKVGVAVEGMGVDHAHVKLYPMHGIGSESGEAKDRVFFDKYPGYISTQLGPQADSAELNELAAKIRGHLDPKSKQ